MRSSVIAFLFLTFLVNRVFAQENFLGDTLSFVGTSQASINSKAGATGTGLPVNFLYKFYRGGNLDTPYLMEVESKLRDFNSLGGSGRNRISYSFDTDSFLLKRAGLVLGLAYEEHWNASANFSREIFHLVFMGNDDFDNRNAVLNPAWFRVFNYRQYSLEVGYRKKIKEATHGLQLQLSYLEGKQFSEIEIIRGSFFTATNGIRVDADIKGNYFQSDTANNGVKRFDKGNGSGYGFSMMYSYEGKKTKLFLGVKDAGFIQWNANSLLISADTTLHLKGYQVYSLKDISDSLFTLSVDSLRNIEPQSRYRKYRMYLPSKFFFESHHALARSGFHLIAGFRYLVDPVYLPLFYTGFSYSKCWGGYLRSTIGFGGYTKVNLGIEYSRRFYKHFSVGAGINQAEGIFHPGNPKGFSGFVGLRYN